MSDRKKLCIMFDFDLTMSTECCQEPIFRENLEKIKEKYNTDEEIIKEPSDYWKMVDNNKGYDREISYLQCLLEDFKDGTMQRNGHNLTDEDLKYYGQFIKLAPGMIDFLKQIKTDLANVADVSIYIVSVGITNIILGSEVAEYVDGIIGTELAATFNSNGHIDSIKKLNTSFNKIASLIEIAKGNSNINEKMISSAYKQEYDNALLIADGMSDIPSFEYAGKKGAIRIGVYDPTSMKAFNVAYKNLGTSVNAVVPRIYTPGSDTYNMILNYLRFMASPNRCNFPPQLIHMERGGKIKHKETSEYIKKHFMECDSEYCSPAILTYQIRPK